MRRFFFLLAVVLLAGCGGGNPTPNDGSDGTQKTGTFNLTYPKTGEFSVARGATRPFTVTADITQPEVVDEVKITLSSGPGVEITPSSETRLGDNASFTFEVKVLESTTQLQPFFNFVAEGVGESNNQELVQATFRWPIE